MDGLHYERRAFGLGQAQLDGKLKSLDQVSMTICLYKVLTRRARANTVLREPQCGPILISKESHE
jgi:hypothetical protein